MARWREQRRLSDEELLRGFQWWRDQSPPTGASREEFHAWREGMRRWCEENGTNALEMIRMQRDERISPEK